MLDVRALLALGHFATLAHRLSAGRSGSLASHSLPFIPHHFSLITFLQRPGGPEVVAEAAAAVGEGGPPLAGLLESAGQVGNAVAVEIADAHVHPRHGRRP